MAFGSNRTHLVKNDYLGRCSRSPELAGLNLHMSPEKRAAELKQIMCVLYVRKVHLNIDGESPKKNGLLVLSLTDSSCVGAAMFPVELS